MTDIYDEFAVMAREMLSPTSRGGLGQGTIVLLRYSQERNDLEPWKPAPSAQQPVRETLLGAASVVRSRFNSGSGMSGDTVVLEGDIRIIASIPTMDWMLDTKRPLFVTIDGGVEMPVVMSSTLPSAGTPVALELIVRGPSK